MKKDELITKADILAQFLHSASDSVAVDTEFMREHTYYPQLCLLQLNSGGQTVCVDVLAFDDLSAFAQLWREAQCEKILHACRQDIEVLHVSLDVMPQNIFDTQVAAAFCGYGEQVSYAVLVERISGVALEKSQTRTDWSKRPLSDKQLIYAADDVEYLPQLRETLSAKLQQKGMLDWFVDECNVLATDAFFDVQPQKAYQRLKAYHKLRGDAKDAARKLAAWREVQAMQKDMPREWVLPTAALIRIAELQPKTATELKQINEVRSGKHRDKVFTRADEIVDCLVNGSPVEAVDEQYVALTSEQKKRLKQCIDIVQSTAESLHISAALLTNRKTLEAFVRGQTDLPLFKGWRHEVVGYKLMQ